MVEDCRKIKQFGLVLLFALLVQPTFAQSKPKNSYARGTLFGHWGYNRSAYTKSDIRFQGYGYDFVMANASAHDNPSRDFSQYVNLKTLTVPQFNYRIGYYFKNNWAISLGQDHMKYLFDDKNHVQINGNVNPGVDTVTNLSGNYDNYNYVTDRTKFHYENSDGLNYIRLQLTRTDRWYINRSEWFAFSTNLSAGLGGILSFNDFRFAGREDHRTISFSGYGISGHLGARFEFFKHVYLQANMGGGFMHQVNVKSRQNDPSASISQKFGYAEMNMVLGFLFYIRPTNDCNSCPHW